MNTLQKMHKARVQLTLSKPFFGHLALRLYLREAREYTDTMATNGVDLYFDPSFVDGLTMPQLAGCIAHEVMHLACAHHARRNGRDVARYNLAGDYVINPLLLNDGVELPEGFVLDPQFDGLNIEQVYNRLAPPDSPEPSGSDSQAGEVAPDGANGSDPGQPPQCPDPGGCGGIMDALGENGPATPVELAAAEREWKIAVTQARQSARIAGKLPGEIEEFVSQQLEPSFDLTDELRRFMERSGHEDYTWSPPNRRYVHAGLHLPLLKSETMPPVVFAIDTSKSLDADELVMFGTRVKGLLLDLVPEQTHVLYCDTRIAGYDCFLPDDLDEFVLHARGRGGTDLRPPFVFVEDQLIHPCCMVYMTDLAVSPSRFPEHEPDYPVLWVVPPGTERHVPWGDVIEMID